MNRKQGFLMIELMVLMTAVILLTALCCHSYVSTARVYARARSALVTMQAAEQSSPLQVISTTAAYQFTNHAVPHDHYQEHS